MTYIFFIRAPFSYPQDPVNKHYVTLHLIRIVLRRVNAASEILSNFLANPYQVIILSDCLTVAMFRMTLLVGNFGAIEL